MADRQVLEQDVLRTLFVKNTARVAEIRRIKGEIDAKRQAIADCDPNDIITLRNLEHDLALAETFYSLEESNFRAYIIILEQLVMGKAIVMSQQSATAETFNNDWRHWYRPTYLTAEECQVVEPLWLRVQNVITTMSVDASAPRASYTGLHDLVKCSAGRINRFPNRTFFGKPTPDGNIRIEGNLSRAFTGFSEHLAHGIITCPVVVYFLE